MTKFSNNVVTLIGELPTGKVLTIKAGFDPTAPDLHLGHLVLLLKLKEFQDAGHQIVVVIGDFTASIGDPTGKNVTRKVLDNAQIQENTTTYLDQLGRVLDLKKTKIEFNSKWLGTLTPQQLMNLASNYTVAQMLTRDDFRMRFENSSPIGIHEFLYPLFQGYDSVVLNSDVEIGGTDQLYNLMVGRELQKLFGQKPQTIMTMPLLVGLDGAHKMSKSLNNYIAFNDTPDNMFGKIMSLSDELMWDYVVIFGVKTPKDVINLKYQQKNPKDVKIMLATFLVTLLHSHDAAVLAKTAFETRFSQKLIDESVLEEIVIHTNGRGENIIAVLRGIGLKSNSEAHRAITQNAIKVNGVKVLDKNIHLSVGHYVVQNGKHNIKRVNIS